MSAESPSARLPGAESAPRRRRRWPIVLLVVVVVLALLVAGLAAVGENLARSYAEDRAQTELASALGVDDPQDVEVDLGSGSVLLQAIKGRLDEVTATTDAVEFSGIRGSVRLVATGVPVSGDAPVERVTARLSIPRAEAAKLAGLAQGITIDALTLQRGQVTASSSARILGASVPVSIVLVPTASGGRLVLTPTTLEAAGQRIDVADLRGSILGVFARQLPENVAICVNERLPRGLGLNGVGVTPSAIELTAAGENVPFGGSGRGSCG